MPNFSLKDMEKKLTTEAVIYTNGNLRQAAKLLNVSVMKMYRLLKIYNIDYAKIRHDSEWKWGR